MKAELKQKWVEALRSGKYVQGTGVLRTTADEYCCLGVLCDLVDRSAWGVAEEILTCVNSEDVPRVAYDFHSHGDSSHYSLPFSLELSLKLTDTVPLINMNDAGESFGAIADWIEQNIPADESTKHGAT
jgi:hypothetical protein